LRRISSVAGEALRLSENIPASHFEIEPGFTSRWSGGFGTGTQVCRPIATPHQCTSRKFNGQSGNRTLTGSRRDPTEKENLPPAPL
jgi:hypothetical protein